MASARNEAPEDAEGVGCGKGVSRSPPEDGSGAVAVRLPEILFVFFNF